MHLCETCKQHSLVLASDKINYTEKMLIEEYPESNFNIFCSLIDRMALLLLMNQISKECFAFFTYLNSQIT